jgi:hypothetical protein
MAITAPPPIRPAENKAVARRRSQRPPRYVYWRRRLAVLVSVLAVLAGSWCVVVARRPGNESFVAKSADWLRDHHLNAVANWVEETYYNHAAPGTGGTPSHAIPGPSALAPNSAATGSRSQALPPPVVPAANPPLPNEGAWRPLLTASNGEPSIAVAQLRPDAQHTSVLGAVVWMNPHLLRFLEVPGTVEPGGSWNTVGTVGGPQRNAMVAAFNGGFRFKDANGGIYAAGQEGKPLVAGAASFVVHSDGRVDIGQWGRDDQLDPTVVSVRQNLPLIVDGGQPTSELNTSDTSRWGKGIHNRVLVFRSGLGIRADGTLVYAASNGLTVSTLADMLVRAGCVRAMELDINPNWVSYNLFTHPDPTRPDKISAQKLLPDMTRPATRFLGPDSRDFTAVLLP